MLKRKIAFVFVFFASIILLAHSAIPHHYHQKLVCVETEHCNDDAVKHQQNALDHQHEDNDSESSESCVLKQSLVLLSYHDRKACNCSQLSHNHDFAFPLSYQAQYVFFPKYLRSDFNSDYTASYSSFLLSSLGLRAPPIG